MRVRRLRFVRVRKFRVEEIARLYHVPYWLIDGRPKPSWLRRPLWRLRAARWAIIPRIPRSERLLDELERKAKIDG